MRCSPEVHQQDGTSSHVEKTITPFTQLPLGSPPPPATDGEVVTVTSCPGYVLVFVDTAHLAS